MRPELNATPRLASGVRLNEKSQHPRMLLLPRGTLRISGPSLEIVQLCDGKNTVRQITEKLHKLYAKAEPERVTADLLSYLELLQTQGAVEY